MYEHYEQKVQIFSVLILYLFRYRVGVIDSCVRECMMCKTFLFLLLLIVSASCTTKKIAETKNNPSADAVKTESLEQRSGSQEAQPIGNDLSTERLHMITDIEVENLLESSENLMPGSEVGTLVAFSEDEHVSYSYSILDTEGTDYEKFTLIDNKIVTSQEISGDRRFILSIKADSDLGSSFEKLIVFSLSAGELPPENPIDMIFLQEQVTENNDVGVEVGSFIVVDDTRFDHDISLLSTEENEDNGYFSLEEGVLYANALFDFETQSTYTISVEARNRDYPDKLIIKDFTVSVANQTTEVTLFSGKDLVNYVDLKDISVQVGEDAYVSFDNYCSDYVNGNYEDLIAQGVINSKQVDDYTAFDDCYDITLDLRQVKPNIQSMRVKCSAFADSSSPRPGFEVDFQNGGYQGNVSCAPDSLDFSQWSEPFDLKGKPGNHLKIYGSKVYIEQIEFISVDPN